MAKCTNDRALRFYNQVLGLDRLHYGLWRQQDELTFENLKIAQQRYEDLITDNIPSEKIRKRYPGITHLILRLLKNRIRKINQQRQLLDSRLFKGNKQYQFMILQSSA